METNPKKQRQHFYRDYASGQWSMSELCDRYQISRPTDSNRAIQRPLHRFVGQWATWWERNK